MALTGTLIISLLLTSMLFVVIPCSKAAFQGPQVQWSRTYPASTLPMAKVIQALDGGYAIVGNNATNDYQGVKIGNRAMVIKTDSYGKVQWAKTYGSEFGVGANVLTIVQTRDSGFAICSYSASGWLLKTDAQGNVQWNTTVSVVLAGETDFTSLAETNDLGFVLTYEGWFGNMSGGYTGLLKTDANGHTPYGVRFIQPKRALPALEHMLELLIKQPKESMC